MVSNHSVYKQIDESLKSMIGSLANNNPAPQEVVIKRTSFDGNRWFADVEFNGGYIRVVPCNGYPKVGSIATMFFLGGSYDYPMLLCNMLDLFDMYTPFKAKNILDNGNFEVFDDEEGFYGWNGDVAIGTDGLYGEQSLLLNPHCTVTSQPIDITQLPLNENELTVIQATYNWLGQAFNLRIKDLTNDGYVTFAPEGLNITTQELDSSTEWCYHRTVFLKREYETVQLEFTNPSDKPVLIDGVRVWVQDFEEWSPSLNDYNGTSDKMNYENEIDKNNVSLKTTLKEIFKDINNRLKELEPEEESTTQQEEEPKE